MLLIVMLRTDHSSTSDEFCQYASPKRGGSVVYVNGLRLTF